MTCVYISTHTCIYSYIHTPSCIYKYIHIHTLHVYMGIFIYKHASMCIHTYATTHTLSLSHTHTPKACLHNQAYLQTQKTCQNKSKETNIYGKKNEKRPKKEPCVFSVVHASASQNGRVDGESQWTVCMKKYTPMYSKRYLQMIYLTYTNTSVYRSILCCACERHICIC